MTTGRRGQATQVVDGRYVAVLILLIALFMILYILFVPPEQRDVLLNQQFGGSSSNTTTLQAGEEILVVAPGEVSPKKEVVQEHTMSSVNVFVKTEPKIVQLASSVLVKTSLFSRQTPAVTFSVDDSDLKKVALFFSVDDAPRGELELRINGNVFFSGEFASGARVVEVPLSFVKETNKVEFRVSHPGLAFWSTNKYVLQQVGVKTEFERINAQEERAFVLSQDEADKVKSAKLAYFQVCNQPLPRQTSMLKVYVNDESVSSGVVRCVTTKQAVDVDGDLFVAGRNTVRFVLEEGDFSFNEVAMTVESREAEFPTYSFIIDSDHARKLAAGKKLMFQVVFENPVQLKNARVFIGDKNFIMQTDAGKFSRDVSSFVREGTNFVRVVPSNTFAMVSLKLVLV